MAIVQLSNDLIKEKRELMIELDECQDTTKKTAIQERIGRLEKEIYQNAMKVMKETKMATPKKEVITKKEFTAKELRKIVNTKRDVYKELAKQAYEFYNECVAKKREGVAIKEMISNKDNKAVKKALEY